MIPPAAWKRASAMTPLPPALRARLDEIVKDAMPHDSTCPRFDNWQDPICDCGWLGATVRLTDDVLALFADPPQVPEASTEDDTRVLMTPRTVQVYRPVVSRLVRATPRPVPDERGCINCGETDQGGYEIEEVGSFCEQCWRFLGEYFARNPLAETDLSEAPPPAPAARDTPNG